MADIRETKVKVAEQIQHGAFANAFRVVKEVGTDCFLDFIVFTEECQEAQVVSRVRVHREFLPILRETLKDAIQELEEVPPTKEGQPVH